ncbi:MAG: B12 binding domain protein [Candidatus Bathyarchaeota archaeon BA1]|nr:MAG: B12 binding domain protein [Candidatus Bathyarchaeota archaeon BA1]
MTSTYPFAMKVVQTCKEIDRQTVTVMGGIHATFMADNILTESNVTDIAVIGEGEYTMLEILRSLSERIDISSVEGLAYQENKQIIRTEPRQFIANLDELPFPARHLFPMQKYHQTHMITSRGCPFECIFCIPRLCGVTPSGIEVPKM